MAGYTAENIMKGLFHPFYVEDVDDIDLQKAVLLDVRTKEEFEAGSIPGALNIPLDSLREEMDKLPQDKEIDVFCQIGLRGYLASRILLQNRFENVKNLSGGYRLWREIQNDKSGTIQGLQHSTVETETQLPPEKKAKEILVDACGLSCPGPIIAVHKAMEGATEGSVFTVRATDPAFAGDIEAFCRRTGDKLLNSNFDGKSFIVTIKKGKDVPESNTSGGNGKSIIVFSGDLDKAIASFIIANGALAMNRDVHMFFTFWGLNILRKAEKVHTKKDFISTMFGHMMPRGSKKLGLSKLNMGGIGAKMIRAVMENKNISSLEDLIQQAMKNGVKITACSMSMDVMGIGREELIDGIQVGGVASFLASAEESDTSLFI
jgi:peroxiredoxin family protein/rhodanese-related sulfurtransferase/TusA-related sulfurtransferase